MGNKAAHLMDEKTYEKELKKLQVELVSLQRWVEAKGLKVCVVFEGRDSAGKGGTIKTISERVNPRIFRVVALAKPTEEERSQLYMQRYISQMPSAGEIVIFDRSWYNRAGVERVMGFCTEEESQRFLDTVPFFEKAMVDAGIILIKYWLNVDMEEQERRLKDRVEDGRKIWKLSPIDLQSYHRWYDYSRARDEMIAATDTSWAPWFVVDSNDKRKARLNIITHLLEQIPYEKLPVPKVKFPPRQAANGYVEPNYAYHLVTDRYPQFANKSDKPSKADKSNKSVKTVKSKKDTKFLKADGTVKTVELTKMLTEQSKSHES